jgi:hypothetical protein
MKTCLFKTMGKAYQAEEFPQYFSLKREGIPCFTKGKRLGLNSGCGGSGVHL